MALDPAGAPRIEAGLVLSMHSNFTPRASRRKPFGVGLPLVGRPLFPFEKRLVGKRRPCYIRQHRFGLDHYAVF